MKHEEAAYQAQLVYWFKTTYPQYRYLIASFANGQNVGPRVGQRLKNMGMLKGMSDLILGIPSGGYHGLLIEMKSQTGRVQPDQKIVHEQWRAQNYAVHVCKSSAEGIAVIKEYLSLGA